MVRGQRKGFGAGVGRRQQHVMVVRRLGLHRQSHPIVYIPLVLLLRHREVMVVVVVVGVERLSIKLECVID